jgi:hypothetical protein
MNYLVIVAALIWVLLETDTEKIDEASVVVDKYSSDIEKNSEQVSEARKGFRSAQVIQTLELHTVSLSLQAMQSGNEFILSLLDRVESERDLPRSENTANDLEYCKLVAQNRTHDIDYLQNKIKSLLVVVRYGTLAEILVC